MVESRSASRSMRWYAYQIPRPMSVMLSASQPNRPIAMIASRLNVELELPLEF
jgi:hypothetical protein